MLYFVNIPKLVDGEKYSDASRGVKNTPLTGYSGYSGLLDLGIFVTKTKYEIMDEKLTFLIILLSLVICHASMYGPWIVELKTFDDESR